MAKWTQLNSPEREGLHNMPMTIMAIKQTKIAKLYPNIDLLNYNLFALFFPMLNSVLTIVIWKTDYIYDNQLAWLMKRPQNGRYLLYLRSAKLKIKIFLRKNIFFVTMY